MMLTVLGEHDGRKPDTDSPNDEIARVWREQFQMSDIYMYKHKTEASGKYENMSINRKSPESSDIQKNGFQYKECAEITESGDGVRHENELGSIGSEGSHHHSDR